MMGSVGWWEGGTSEPKFQRLSGFGAYTWWFTCTLSLGDILYFGYGFSVTVYWTEFTPWKYTSAFPWENFIWNRLIQRWCPGCCWTCADGKYWNICGSVHHCPAPRNVLHPACSTLALLPRPFPGLSLMPSTSGTSGLALVTAVWLEPHRWPECCTPVLGVCSLWAPERLPRVPPFFRLPGSLIILWVCVEEAGQQNLPGYAPRLSSES